jgi:hypothetical protein
MPTPRPHPAHARRGGAAYLLVLFILAGAVFAGLAVYLRGLQREAVTGAAIRDQLTSGGAPRPLADITRTLREMKLVTVEIDSKVLSESDDQSWRGDVAAKVETPVRLLYGVDLSRITTDRLAFSPVGGAYLVRIPPPERIATEICGGDESIDVQVGWARLRSRAGEYYLGLARRDLYERARELTLSPEDARTVREATREQTEAAIRKIVGPAAPVTVAFEDDLP